MLCLLFLFSCDNTFDTANTPETDSKSPTCMNDSLLTWNNWGEGFFQTWCQSCHSRNTPQRNGAPENLNFDTLDDVIKWQSSIFDSVIASERMPKGGGIPAGVQQQLIEYMDCLQ